MSPGVFVDLLARVLDEPRESIVVVDRVLAVAKLRSVGGRGSSAARITAEDAVVIVIAVMATTVLTRADEVVRRWRRVACYSLPKNAPERLRPLLPLAGGQTLVDCLVRLITADPASWRDIHIVLDLGVESLTAELRFELGGKRSQKFSIQFAEFVDPEEAHAKARPKEGDLWRRASVTGETFKVLHDAVVTEPEAGGET